MPKILRHCGFKITQEYFDDEDELEEQLLEELKEVRKAEEEEKMKLELEEKLKQEERRRLEKEEKEELKRLGVKSNWFGTPEIRPKRLESNMPTLIVNSLEDEEFPFEAKELESTQPTLVVDERIRVVEESLNVLQIGDSAERNKLTGSKLEAQLLRYASEHPEEVRNLTSGQVSVGAGDILVAREEEDEDENSVLQGLQPSSPLRDAFANHAHSPILDELTQNPHSGLAFQLKPTQTANTTKELEKPDFQSFMLESDAMEAGWGEDRL